KYQTAPASCSGLRSYFRREKSQRRTHLKIVGSQSQLQKQGLTMHSKYVTFLSAFCRTKLWLSVVLLIGSLLSYSAYAAQVVATVSSDEVGVNEIFELTISIDDNVSASALDLSPLKNDFIVGTTSTRSMNRFINGS